MDSTPLVISCKSYTSALNISHRSLPLTVPEWPGCSGVRKQWVGRDHRAGLRGRRKGR